MTSRTTAPARTDAAGNPRDSIATPPTSPVVQANEPSPRRPRDTSVDAAVGVLIILVVIGHALGPLDGALPDVLREWMYMFHMPAFVLVSGYLTRLSSRWSPATLLSRLLFPYVVFQIVLTVIRALVTDADLIRNPLIPAWTTWYLLSLLTWRLAAPALKRVPYLLPLSVVVALAAGFVPHIGQEFSLSRTLGFLPFFVIGFLWRDEWWTRLRAVPVRVGAAVLLVGSLVAVAIFHERLAVGPFLLRADYGELADSPPEGLAHRAAVLVIGAALALSFLAVMGWSRPGLASIGAGSIAVYLLHAAVLSPVELRGYPDAVSEVWGTVAIVVGSALFAYVVTRPRMLALARPLMDFTWWTARLRRSRATGADAR